MLGVDYKDFTDVVGFPTEEDSEPLRTPIDYFNFTAAYNSSRHGERTGTSYSAGANFGIRGLGNSRQEFEDKRFKAQPDYFYLTGSIEHTRQIFDHWELYLSGTGQLSQQPLISNEQFTMGGLGTVGGYLEAEQLADYGASARFELREITRAQRSRSTSPGYVFYDWAGAQFIEPLPDQTSRASSRAPAWDCATQAQEAGRRRSTGPPLLDGAQTQSDQRVDFSVRPRDDPLPAASYGRAPQTTALARSSVLLPGFGLLRAGAPARRRRAAGSCVSGTCGASGQR